MLGGLNLSLLKPPKLTWGCPESLKTNPTQSRKLEEFLVPWLKEGIVAVGSAIEKGHFSRLFTVPKDKVNFVQ